jgi:hypothetical protein
MHAASNQQGRSRPNDQRNALRASLTAGFLIGNLQTAITTSGHNLTSAQSQLAYQDDMKNTLND